MLRHKLALLLQGLIVLANLVLLVLADLLLPLEVLLLQLQELAVEEADVVEDFGDESVEEAVLAFLGQDLLDDLFDLVLDGGHLLGLLIEADDLLKIDDSGLVQSALIRAGDHLDVIYLQVVLLKIADMMLVVPLNGMILVF